MITKASLSFVLIGAVFSILTSPAYALVVGRYESIKLAEPKGRARGIVVFFSDAKGLSTNDDAAAQILANARILVTEVDSKRYLSALDKLNEKCHWLAYDAEILSRQLQREHHFPGYLPPIVAGVGEGGTLAELTLAESAPGTIAGAVAIDPSEFIASRRPICSSLATTSHPGGFDYGAPQKLSGFWVVGLTSTIRQSDREYILRLRTQGAGVDIQEIAAGTSLGDALRVLILPHLATPRPMPLKIPVTRGISDLPLIELPVQHPSSVMAIVLSGDGGWRDIDKTVADDIQARGVPVVGLDCLRYFWSRKTPEQITEVVEALIATFAEKWHAEKVVLIGYSFGADVMPFVYNRLPPDVREHVVLVALMGLAKSANFEISVGDWLGAPPGPDALPVVPEAARIAPRLVQCFYGQDEKDTACPILQLHGVEAFRRSGGHHFDANYGAVAELILTGLRQRTGAPPSR